ncbi:MAG: DUF6599 family protein [Planctomycetota bacterium]
MPPQQAVPTTAPPTAEALPARSGNLRITGPKATFEGPDELFDYINGGAEPYLTLKFIRVTTAQYTDGQNELKVDLWQFETSDDAFGAFAKDRRGEPVAVGDEGAMLGASLWAWRGRFMFNAIDLAQTPPEQVRLLASEALAALEEPPAERPAICRRLPPEGLQAGSVLFMRDAKPLFNVQLAPRFIPDQVWGFTEGAVGAYGAYELRDEGKPTGLLLIRHETAQAAEQAAERLAALRADWGEERVREGPYVVFRAAEGDYRVLGSREGLFAAVFSAPSPEAAAELLDGALP